MSNPSNNPKPRSSSLSLEVNKSHKSAARILFHDDYITNNTLEFEGNLRGTNESIQHKSVINVNMKETNPFFYFNEEARLDFRLHEDSVFRLKFRPISVLAHIDLGQNSWSTTVQDQDLNFWFNPYIQYQATRAMTNGSVFLGLITSLNNGLFSNNVRFRLHNQNDVIDGEFENNWTIKYNNWLFNWYYIDDLRNWSKNVARKLTAEYLTDTLSISAELDKTRRSHISDWDLDTISVGAAYQHNRDLTYGVWSATELQNNNETTIAAGIHYRVHRDVAIKAKFDTKQDIGVFANYNIGTGLNINMSVQSSADASRIREVYNDAFKFGLKLKYDS